MLKNTIKSFVIRTGRISPRQKHGLDNLLAHYSLPLSQWNYKLIFNRDAPTFVEIGFGMGTSLIQMAKENLDINYIGIEVHKSGIGNLAADINDNALLNIRIAPYDAVEIFQAAIPDHSLMGVQIFFPDPWPKRKHIKRRLIQNSFIDLLVQKLLPGGIIHIATDWQPYAEHCLSLLKHNPNLQNNSHTDTYIVRPNTRPLTKFEQRGKDLGHEVFDIMFTFERSQVYNL